MTAKPTGRILVAFLMAIASLFSASIARAATNPHCTQTLSVGADVGSSVTNAPAGAVICLNPGTYNESPSITSDHGVAGNPVTLTSTDPTNPATLNGRFVTYGSSSYLNINQLKFTWSSGISDTMALATDHMSLTNNDISGSSGTICLDLVPYGGGQFTNSLVDHNLIHACGNPASSSDRIHGQGIYTTNGTDNNVISNNWCYNVAARCYQIRGGSNNVWHNNTADDANWGVLYGDLSPTNNDVYDNIIGPDVKVYGSGYAAGGMLVFGSPSNGSGNVFRNNCMASSVINGSSAAAAVFGNTVTDVQFVDAANHNYNLSSSPSNDACRAYQVQNGNPGPGGGVPPSTPQSPPPATAPITQPPSPAPISGPITQLPSPAPISGPIAQPPSLFPTGRTAAPPPPRSVHRRTHRKPVGLAAHHRHHHHRHHHHHHHHHHRHHHRARRG